MAPKAMKRPAAAAAGPNKKACKGRNSDPNFGKCEAIVREFQAAKDLLPAGLYGMLAGMAPLALCTPREERHQFQAEVTEMVGSSIGMIEQAIEKEIADNQGKSNVSAEEKVSRDQARDEAEKALADLRVTTAATKKTLDEDSIAEDTAKASFKKAKQDQKSGDKDIDAAVARKESLEALMQKDFLPLKEISAGDSLGKEAIKRLEKAGKQLSVDAALLKGLPLVLVKAPSDRSTFENIMMEQFEGEVQRKIAAVEKTLEEGRPAKEERGSCIEAANHALEAAAEKKKASCAAYDEAVAAEEAGIEKLKAAEKSIHSFLPDMKALMDKLDKAKVRLAAFRTGPVTFYSELKDFVKPVEVEEPAAEEAVEAAPPAAAEERAPEASATTPAAEKVPAPAAEMAPDLAQ